LPRALGAVDWGGLAGAPTAVGGRPDWNVPAAKRILSTVVVATPHRD
jgi:hypothetical protein